VLDEAHLGLVLVVLADALLTLTVMARVRAQDATTDPARAIVATVAVLVAYAVAGPGIPRVRRGGARRHDRWRPRSADPVDPVDRPRLVVGVMRPSQRLSGSPPDDGQVGARSRP
jgi:hypothetical protein